MRTNIHNVQSCCERLALADVDRCTAMKSECTIMVRSDFIVVHRKFRLSIVKPSYLGLAEAAKFQYVSWPSPSLEVINVTQRITLKCQRLWETGLL